MAPEVARMKCHESYKNNNFNKSTFTFLHMIYT